MLLQRLGVNHARGHWWLTFQNEAAVTNVHKLSKLLVAAYKYMQPDTKIEVKSLACLVAAAIPT